jgi:outer membrane translocation and assembly module TamA
VTLTVNPGPSQKIVKVIEEPVDGLRPGTLERYRAFNLGDPYNARNLSLTSKRIEVIDGILQSSYFLTECTDEGAVLTQKSITGPRQLIKIGAGVNTEDFIIGKLSWRWVRIGKNGSSVQLSFRGSLRKQWFNAQGFIYPLSEPSRWHLNPIAVTQRQDEDQFEYTSFDVAFPAAITWTTQNTGFRLRFGPKFNFTNTTRGAEPGDTYFVSGSVRLTIADNDYQYYLGNPQGGYVVNAAADFNHDAVLSSVTAQQLKVRGQAFWNIANLDPALFIVAVRGFAGATLTETGNPSFERLPPSFLYYLGGSTTLRGFSRRNLPNEDRGGLTSLYAGVEGRLAYFLPLNIQPLALIDIGALGQESMDLDFPVYWSPGFGARWPSMIGLFRLTAAYGLLINNNDPANDDLEGWKVFFSYGEEF